MPKIYQLDKRVAELIAAGEVVERPAAVIKEVVENAIDAGATAVTVEIRKGGIAYMRVTDNGCGIDREDISTAFLRNATSKVRTEEDLAAIGTLGFRGEALASIAAVSRVTMVSRVPEAELGTRIRLEGGEVLDLEEAGGPVGTTITIRDLFYNTPARMKFLKKDVTEANAVAATMDRLALSHPSIAFKFIRDGKTAMFSPGSSDLQACIYSVFGKDFAKSLIEVKNEQNGVVVEGFVSKPEECRGSRGMQYFFVNGRFVKTVTGQSALEEAYKHEIMINKFPGCVLFVRLPEHMVDVNTHPAKIEIRFVDERSVYDAVYFGVKNALAQQFVPPSIDLANAAQRTLLKNESLGMEAAEQLQIRPVKPRPQSQPPVPTDGAVKPVWREAELERPTSLENLPLYQPEPDYSREETVGEAVLPEAEALEAMLPMPMTEALPFEVPEAPLQETPLSGEDTEAATFDLTQARFIGEAFATYVIVEMEGQLYFIDKHAAHERLLYEELKKNRNIGGSQVLLEPLSLNFPKEEYNLLLENSLELAEAGIMIDDFGGGTILIREFPAQLAAADIGAVLEEIADGLKKGKREISPSVLDELYHSIACKAAIKGNDRNSPEELLALLRMLQENGEIQHCPHGRPVAAALGKKELEKRFGRIV